MHVKIHTEFILTKFAKMAHVRRAELYRVWIVSPWITYAKTGNDPLVTLCIAASEKKPPIVVITRPPEVGNEDHIKGLNLLMAHGKTTAYTLPSLHSKIYLLHCDGFRAAFFGSPNFTVSGNKRNQEIAIDLRTTAEGNKDKISALINELDSYVSSLRSEATLFTGHGDR